MMDKTAKTEKVERAFSGQGEKEKQKEEQSSFFSHAGCELVPS